MYRSRTIFFKWFSRSEKFRKQNQCFLKKMAFSCFYNIPNYRSILKSFANDSTECDSVFCKQVVLSFQMIQLFRSIPFTKINVFFQVCILCFLKIIFSLIKYCWIVLEWFIWMWFSCSWANCSFELCSLKWFFLENIFFCWWLLRIVREWFF